MRLRCVVIFLLLYSGQSIAECEDKYPGSNPKRQSPTYVEYFERKLSVDLSEVGEIEDYPGIDGFYSKIAVVAGLADSIKTYVSSEWPEVRPGGLIRYWDDCWYFFLIEFDRSSDEMKTKWKRFIGISYSREIKDYGDIDPDSM